MKGQLEDACGWPWAAGPGTMVRPLPKCTSGQELVSPWKRLPLSGKIPALRREGSGALGRPFSPRCSHLAKELSTCYFIGLGLNLK